MWLTNMDHAYTRKLREVYLIEIASNAKMPILRRHSAKQAIETYGPAYLSDLFARS
jgi:hypothetical protein